MCKTVPDVRHAFIGSMSSVMHGIPYHNVTCRLIMSYCLDDPLAITLVMIAYQNGAPVESATWVLPRELFEQVVNEVGRPNSPRPVELKGRGDVLIGADDNGVMKILLTSQDGYATVVVNLLHAMTFNIMMTGTLPKSALDDHVSRIAQSELTRIMNDL